MLTILPADTPNPTKAYADACWHENPAISPNWWREMQGHTIGKIAQDARLSVPVSISTGINLILTTPSTHAAVNAPAGSHLKALVVDDNDIQGALALRPDYIIWQGDAPAPFAQLETAVQQGQLHAYGVTHRPQHPLHRVLEEAAAAAQTVHGRRKRPALRLLLAQLDLLNLSLLTTVNTLHKEEPVTTLELAARLDLSVILADAAMPDAAPPNAAALAALQQVAQAEHVLAESLEGWPVVQGQPLFSVLMHLQAGQAPWPTPHHAALWVENVWNGHLRPFLGTLPPPHAHPAAVLVAAYSHLVPTALFSLAQAAAQPALQAALAHIIPSFPISWQSLPPATQAAGLLTSIPGITALALAQPDDMQALQKAGDLPDIGFLLL